MKNTMQCVAWGIPPNRPSRPECAFRQTTDTSRPLLTRTPAMKPVVIENPILNSPFEEPKRHHVFDEDGITDQVADSRRRSTYFIPIAAPKKKGKQLTFDTLWTQD